MNVSIALEKHGNDWNNWAGSPFRCLAHRTGGGRGWGCYRVEYDQCVVPLLGVFEKLDHRPDLAIKVVDHRVHAPAVGVGYKRKFLQKFVGDLERHVNKMHRPEQKEGIRLSCRLVNHPLHLGCEEGLFEDAAAVLVGLVGLAAGRAVLEVGGWAAVGRVESPKVLDWVAAARLFIERPVVVGVVPICKTGTRSAGTAGNARQSELTHYARTGGWPHCDHRWGHHGDRGRHSARHDQRQYVLPATDPYIRAKSRSHGPAASGAQ